MQKRFASMWVLVAALGLAGCGDSNESAGIEMIDNTPAAVGSDPDVGTEAAGLMGAYEASEGTLLGLVLAKKDGKRVFVADQQVMCFKAPCMPAHLAGTWSAVDGTLRLTENANKHVYDYTLDQGKLTLTDQSNHKKVGQMSKVETWCGESPHCDLQVVPQPMASTGTKRVCLADQTCGITSGDSAGYGDSCEDDCIEGLRCQSGVCAP